MVADKATIIIGGDVCPIGCNKELFKRGDALTIFKDLLIDIQTADLSIVNLECPLINQTSPIYKYGPILGVESECVRGIKNSKITLLNLANNHIFDHGTKGLKSTLDVCNEMGIDTVGAGEDIEKARRIYIKLINGIRVAVLGACEHEFSIATTKSYGANPLDLIDYVNTVNANKKLFDYLIVLFHGGNENYPYPNPELKKVCHFLVDMGANAVIVQHTHCPGGYEIYNNSYIIYGQGNLIFDWPNRDETWYHGFLVKLIIYGKRRSEIELIPYTQSKPEVGARRLYKADEQNFFNALKHRSDNILDDEFIENNWTKFCEEKKNFYLSKLLGHNPLITTLNKKGHIVRYLYFKRSLAALYNVYHTESHRQILKTIFKEFYEKWCRDN